MPSYALAVLAMLPVLIGAVPAAADWVEDIRVIFHDLAGLNFWAFSEVVGVLGGLAGLWIWTRKPKERKSSLQEVTTLLKSQTEMIAETVRASTAQFDAQADMTAEALRAVSHSMNELGTVISQLSFQAQRNNELIDRTNLTTDAVTKAVAQVLAEIQRLQDKPIGTCPHAKRVQAERTNK